MSQWPLCPVGCWPVVSQRQFVFHIFKVSESSLNCWGKWQIFKERRRAWVTCRGVLRAGGDDVFKEGVPLDIQYVALVAAHFRVMRVQTTRLKQIQHNAIFYTFVCLFVWQKTKTKLCMTSHCFDTKFLWGSVRLNHWCYSMGLSQSQKHLQPIPGWHHSSFLLTPHSKYMHSNYFPHAGGKFLTSSHMLRCAWCLQRIRNICFFLFSSDTRCDADKYLWPNGEHRA